MIEIGTASRSTLPRSQGYGVIRYGGSAPDDCPYGIRAPVSDVTLRTVADRMSYRLAGGKKISHTGTKIDDHRNVKRVHIATYVTGSYPPVRTSTTVTDSSMSWRRQSAGVAWRNDMSDGRCTDTT